MKRIAILGFGITGQAVAKYFAAIRKSEQIDIFDKNEKEKFDPKIVSVLAEHPNIHFCFGENSPSDVSQYGTVILSPGIYPSHPIFDELKKHPEIEIHNDLTLFIDEWREKYNGPIVGVTGSNGKSTTVSLIYGALRASSKESILVGNIGKSPVEYLLDDLDRNTVVVVEISSYQLELFKPHHYADVAVITNISENHLDRYDGDIQEYAKTKFKIFNPDYTQLIVDGDDRGINEYILPLVTKGDVTTVSLRDNSHELPDDIDFANLKLKGEHNMYNMSLTLAVLEKLHIPLDEGAAEFLQSYPGLEHRIEFVENINGVDFINDSKSTSPDAMKASLETFGQDKNLVLIAGGTDKKVSFGIIKDHFAQSVKFVVIINNQMNETFQKMAQTAGAGHIIVENMSDAVREALKNASSGDTVLLSPGAASFGQYRNFEERGQVFKSEVRKLAASVGQN